MQWQQWPTPSAMHALAAALLSACHCLPPLAVDLLEPLVPLHRVQQLQRQMRAVMLLQMSQTRRLQTQP